MHSKDKDGRAREMAMESRDETRRETMDEMEEKRQNQSGEYGRGTSRDCSHSGRARNGDRQVGMTTSDAFRGAQSSLLRCRPPCLFGVRAGSRSPYLYGCLSLGCSRT